MADQVIVQVRFTINEDGQSFSDALNFTEAEYGAVTDKEIEQMKKERFNNWKAFVEEQSKKERPEPTEEELLSQKEVLESQLEEVNARLEKGPIDIPKNS